MADYISTESHTIEPELRSRPPRRAVRRPGGARPIVVASMIAFLMLLFAIGAAVDFADLVGIARYGTPTTGVVTRTSIVEGNHGTSYWVDYSYQVNGRTYYHSNDVGSDAYDNYFVGDNVRVIVWNKYPRWNAYIATPSGRPPDMVIVPFFIVLFGASAWAVWAGIVGQSLRQRALVINGDVAVGSVTGLKVVKGRSVIYYVSFAFRAEGIGALRNETIASRMVVKRANYNSLTEGQPVTVLYAPSNPKRCAIYQCCDYAVASTSL